MRCLHCGKRLSLLRKLSDAEFCSSEHRQEFQQQQRDLALARLIESHNRIDRPKPAPPAKPARGNKKQETEPVFPMAQPARETISAVATLRIHTPESQLETRAGESDLPLPDTLLSPRGFPAPGPIPLAQPLAATSVAAFHPSGSALFRLTVQLPRHTAAPFCPQLLTTNELFALNLALLALQPDALLVATAPVPVPPMATEMPASGLAPTEIQFAPEPFGNAAVPVGYDPAIDVFALAESVEDDLSWPFSYSLETLPLRALASDILTRVIGHDPITPGCHPLSASLRLPLDALRLAPEPAARPAGSLEPLRLQALNSTALSSSPAPPLPAATQDSLRPKLIGRNAPAGWPTAQHPVLHPVATHPALTAARRAAFVPAAIVPNRATGLPPAPMLCQPSLRPVRRAARIQVKALSAAAGAGVLSPSPQLSGLERVLPLFASPTLAAGLPAPGQSLLSICAHPSSPAPWINSQAPVAPAISATADAAYPRTSLRPVPPGAQDPKPAPAPPDSQPESTEALPPLQGMIPVMLPRPAFVARPAEPLWAEPVMELRHQSGGSPPRTPSCRLMIDHADGSGARFGGRESKAKRTGSLFKFAPPRIPGQRFWLHAPADLKWVALGLPLLVILVVYSFRSSAPTPVAPEVADSSKGKTVLGAQMNSLQKVLLHRAAIKLFDDFRGGLGAWHGNGGWSETWKYGDASFLEPGQLALYSPTVDMRDYSFQFLGQVERKSLNWVFRASDTKNYYSMRIVITKGGPLPIAHLIRSTVRNGKELDVKTLPVPFSIRPDTLYLVKMDVRNSDFTTYIQGQVVDTFTDSTLQSGGIGFYCPKGEKSFLRWVEVTHQYDFIGRLCAMLTPYDITTQTTRNN